LRAVVVYFNNTGEMAWIYTNLTKKECSTLLESPDFSGKNYLKVS